MTAGERIHDRVTLHCGDCLETMRAMKARGETVHAVVTDPPYHLTSIVKRFGAANAAPAQHGTDGAFARASKGFMGKQWDGGDIAFQVETWRAVWDVLPPGGHLIAFGGSRTFHRMVCAIEDAGFEVRDVIMFLYGTGFPKSHNINKKLGDDACRCEETTERDVRHLRKSHVSAPVNAGPQRGEILQQGMPEQGSPHAGREELPSDAGGGEPLMEGRRDPSSAARELCERALCAVPCGSCEHGQEGRLCDGAPTGDGAQDRAAVGAGGGRASPGPSAAEQPTGEPGVVAGQPQPQDGGAWPHCDRCGKPRVPDGIGSALKPAYEPILLARKPLDRSSIAANTLAHRTGGINIDACRIGSGEDQDNRRANKGGGGVWNGTESAGLDRGILGRWPANVVHDGSEEVEAAFAAFGERRSGELHPWHDAKESSNGSMSGKNYAGRVKASFWGDAGTASRFFYSAKATSADRAGSSHPTVKPQALMRWLVRMVTPPGGTVLDPFAGSGSTGAAAVAEGFSAVLCERENEYQSDIRRRFIEASNLEPDLLDYPGQQHLPLFEVGS